MVVGFNHNFLYRGEVYHVQTEDSGAKNPHVITLLYHGGTILASKKTSYADILKAGNLEQVVEELMKGQHKEMLRRLKDGELDDLLGKVLPDVVGTAEARQPAPAAPSVAGPAVSPAAPSPPPPAPAQAAEKGLELSLDEMILSYLVGEDS